MRKLVIDVIIRQHFHCGLDEWTCIVRRLYDEADLFIKWNRLEKDRNALRWFLNQASNETLLRMLDYQACQEYR